MSNQYMNNIDKNVSRFRKKPDIFDGDMSKDVLVNTTSVDMEDGSAVQSNLRGDRKNVALLLFLYLLQGIPLGLSAAIPMLLQNRGVSYKQQVRLG